MDGKLKDALTQMKEADALAIAKGLLENGVDPVAVLDACTQAMEEVGKRFEQGLYFLPELMMAGEMLKQISAMVKPYISDRTESKKRGRVLIGTVQGDIHDIGKDIVTFLLDVNGFDVRDIGIDVPPATFVDAIREFKPQVVGMSGLLTLAFDAMKDTVDAIRQAGLRDEIKIIIGGGQMSDKISVYAGADACAKDAIDGINRIKTWMGGAS